jgi:hypothetical protein
MHRFAEVRHVRDFDFQALPLMRTARHYDLGSQIGRTQSNKDLTNFFIALQQWIKPEISYEIGAYNARFSVFIREHLPEICSIAFEANPYIYNLFRNNPDIVKNRIKYLNFAIANQNKAMDFFIKRNLQGVTVDIILGNNSLLIRNEDDHEYEVVRVPTRGLIPLSQGRPHIAAVPFPKPEFRRRPGLWRNRLGAFHLLFFCDVVHA